MSISVGQEHVARSRILRRLVGAMLAVAAAMIGVFGLVSLVSLGAINREVETNSGRIAERSMEKDLNVALKLMQDHQARVEEVVAGFARRNDVATALAARDLVTLRRQMSELPAGATHFLTVIDAQGTAVVRATGPRQGDSLAEHPLVRAALSGRPSAGLWLETPSFLEREGLAERARISVIATEGADSSAKTEEGRGLMAGGAYPVKSADGRTIGVVLGGFMHNHDYQFVDVVREAIYKGMEEAGTATLFLDDVRISTNVHTIDGQRAVGTRVSRQVAETVLRDRRHFRGRAFVVRDWYMAGYEPLRDIQGQVIGIIYVGVLETPIKAPFRSMYAGMRNALVVLLSIGAVLGIGLALLLSRWSGRRLTRPIESMTGSLRLLATGDLTTEIADPETRDELGELQGVLKAMATSLRDMIRSTRDGIQALTTATSQIAVTAKQSQATAAEQASAVQEVGSTIQEIGATSKAVLERAHEVVEMSEHAVETGQRGVHAVGEAQRGLELLAKVAEIVETVNELAEQSNVLAVNAAIEAARAGERGKGFAVVAGEVRSLAGQSKKAARQIREILARVESSGTAIANASNVIRELGDALEQTADRARQIAAAAGQQAAGMSQIASAMEQVVQGGRDTAEGARQLQSAVTDLGSLTADLRTQGARYKV